MTVFDDFIPPTLFNYKYIVLNFMQCLNQAGNKYEVYMGSLWTISQEGSL